MSFSRATCSGALISKCVSNNIGVVTREQTHPRRFHVLLFSGSTSKRVRDKQSEHTESRKFNNYMQFGAELQINLILNRKDLCNQQSDYQTAKIRLLWMFNLPTWSRILRPLQTLQSLFLNYLHLIRLWVLVPAFLPPHLLLFPHLSVSQTVHQSVARHLLCQQMRGWMLFSRCKPNCKTASFPAEEECRPSGFLTIQKFWYIFWLL